MIQTFHVEKNNEDLEVGGYFAYVQSEWKNWTGEKWMLLRGYGDTPRQAIACLCAVLDENDGAFWGREPQKFI